MSWEYDKSIKRIRHHLDTMGKIEIYPFSRTDDLEELLRETVCREIYGSHVYVAVPNFARMASLGSGKANKYQRLIQAVHLYQRAVTQLVELFGGECIHFQGAKLHALFYQPRRQRAFNRGAQKRRQLSTQAVLFELALKEFVQAIFNPAFPGFGDFTIAAGTDQGIAIGTRDGIKGDQELLFLGSEELHGVPRKGQALLQGIVRCGYCGAFLHLRYSGPQGDFPVYVCNNDQRQFGGKRCQEVRAIALDAQVEHRFLVGNAI